METTIIEAVPIRIDVDGVRRIGKTRVTLDTIISAYQEGATAEEIALAYSSVSLADIYSIIAYYLRRQAEVDAYLDKRQKQAKLVRQENENRFLAVGIRERLLARKANNKL